jgi:hypothetical protein
MNRYESRPIQVKGVGAPIALTFLLTLEDPHRFSKSRDVGGYLGLQPGRRNSGQSEPAHAAGPNPQDETEVVNQVAAPAETRTPNMHRANESLPESANGSMPTWLTRLEKNRLEQRTHLTSTGLLMEGVSTQNNAGGHCALFVRDCYPALFRHLKTHVVVAASAIDG